MPRATRNEKGQERGIEGGEKIKKKRWEKGWRIEEDLWKKREASSPLAKGPEGFRWTLDGASELILARRSSGGFGKIK